MMASSYAGLSRSNIAQQSSKGSLFTSFEDVEVTITSSVIIVASFRIPSARLAGIKAGMLGLPLPGGR